MCLFVTIWTPYLAILRNDGNTLEFVGRKVVMVGTKIYKKMKKIILLSITLLIMATSLFANPNPIVRRLSAQEVAQCTTPAAVAYNFVIAALGKDFDRMYSYMSKDGWQCMQHEMDKYEVKSLKALFSLDGKLHIFTWQPALYQGYEVAVLYVQDEGMYDGVEYKKVYIGCVPSSQIGVVGFQDIERYDNETNVKVLVVWEDGKWRVMGFK